MNFASWSIRNPIPAILLFLLLSLAGIWGFHKLPVANLPDVDLPTITVTLTQPGAAPAQLETEVVRKVENSLAMLAGLKHTSTSITDGRAEILVEFVLEKSLSDALIETKDAIDRVRADLPADLQSPSVTAVTNDNESMLTYAVVAPSMTEEELSWYIDNTISKTVLAVRGIGKFERIGGVSREIRVEVDPARLAGLGVTANDVSRALRNTHMESSGGRSQLGGADQAVRTIASIRQAGELAALPIALGDGRKLRLDQVARVDDTYAERSQAALLDGEPVVAFRLNRAKGFDETRIATAVQQALDTLAADSRVRFIPVSGTVTHTKEQFSGSMTMLYEGALLAVLVVWGFLRDWRATVVSAAAMPLSILPAFAAMYWLGYSLNTLTLLALAAVIGILVDDAIVEIENIERHTRKGKSVRQATVDAVNEITLAVIATTMTLVVVFLPTAMMAGVPGRFFKQFGLTAVVAVLSSLLVARLLTPVMAAYWLKPSSERQRSDGPLMTRYLQAVRWSLAHRRITLVLTGLVFIGSLALLPLLDKGLVPAPDQGYISVNLELPPGSSLETTVATAEATRQALDDLPGVKQVFTAIGAGQSVGGGLSQAGEVRRGSLILMLAPRGERARQSEIERTVRNRLLAVPGARFSLGMGGLGEKMALILASEDSVALKSSAEALVRELRGVGKLANITTTASLERPELVVRPDVQRAAEFGVSTASISDAVRVATSGDLEPHLAKLNLDTRQIGLRVRLPDSARRDIDTLSNLRVPARSGTVPLSSIASLEIESGPAQINRYDRKRYVTVSADLNGTPLGEALAAAEVLPAVRALPSTVKLIQTGDAEIMMEMISGLGMAIVVGVLCVLCILVVLFKNFLQPITILSALPLSLVGAFVALLVGKSQLCVPSMIGLVMLMGIVTKNSILLIDYAEAGKRERGLSLDDALLDACHKRARPIIMTTAAMVVGMLPIAFELGADASFRRPMAVAVIGGLISSTGLSLLVVPVVCTYVEGFGARLTRLFRRRSCTVPASPATATT